MTCQTCSGTGEYRQPYARYPGACPDCTTVASASEQPCFLCNGAGECRPPYARYSGPCPACTSADSAEKTAASTSECPADASNEAQMASAVTSRSYTRMAASISKVGMGDLMLRALSRFSKGLMRRVCRG